MQHIRVLIVSFVVFGLSAHSFAEPVNVNSASAEAIAKSLDGIGITKARAIVAYRNENGPFETASDLTQVVGIGKRTVALNADDIVLSDSTEEAATE
ncbi:MAG: helix-hairpin-helix domain-containing protein [Pseudomonadota bacterium]